MPYAAPRACQCGALVPSGKYCPRCYKPREQQRKAAIDAQRPNAGQRGYDAAWQRCRKLFIEQHPVCCAPGCDEAATDVDHIESVKDRPDLRLSWSNLRPFCHSHHSQRTARDQGFARPGIRRGER